MSTTAGRKRGGTVGVIPARWASTRLPGKSLVKICGKPLIQLVVERVRLARRLDRVLVATDHEDIARVVRGIGGEAIMTRPDHPSGTDRVAEAVQGIDATVVVNIQGDEPLIDPALVDELAERMQTDDRWNMATAAAPIKEVAEIHNPSVVKVVWDADHRALYFSRSPVPFVRGEAHGGEKTGRHWRHLGIYAYRRSFLERFVQAPPCRLEEAEKLEQLRALYLGGSILIVETSGAGIGVDTPEDVKYVESILRSKTAADGRGETSHA